MIKSRYIDATRPRSIINVRRWQRRKFRWHRRFVLAARRKIPERVFKYQDAADIVRGNAFAARTAAYNKGLKRKAPTSGYRLLNDDIAAADVGKSFQRRPKGTRKFFRYNPNKKVTYNQIMWPSPFIKSVYRFDHSFSNTGIARSAKRFLDDLRPELIRLKRKKEGIKPGSFTQKKAFIKPYLSKIGRTKLPSFAPIIHQLEQLPSILYHSVPEIAIIHEVGLTEGEEYLESDDESKLGPNLDIASDIKYMRWDAKFFKKARKAPFVFNKFLRFKYLQRRRIDQYFKLDYFRRSVQGFRYDVYLQTLEPFRHFLRIYCSSTLREDTLRWGLMAKRWPKFKEVLKAKTFKKSRKKLSADQMDLLKVFFYYGLMMSMNCRSDIIDPIKRSFDWIITGASFGILQTLEDFDVKDLEKGIESVPYTFASTFRSFDVKPKVLNDPMHRVPYESDRYNEFLNKLPLSMFRDSSISLFTRDINYVSLVHRFFDNANELGPASTVSVEGSLETNIFSFAPHWRLLL